MLQSFGKYACLQYVAMEHPERELSRAIPSWTFLFRKTNPKLHLVCFLLAHAPQPSDPKSPN